MHEHGLIDTLFDKALAEADRRGGQLRALHVRLGALSTSTEEHFRGDFEHVRDERGLGQVELHVEMAPDHPAGLELLSIELRGGSV